MRRPTSQSHALASSAIFSHVAARWTSVALGFGRALLPTPASGFGMAGRIESGLDYSELDLNVGVQYGAPLSMSEESETVDRALGRGSPRTDLLLLQACP